MQVVLHAGAHVTDEDRLVKCLLENQDLLESEGTLAPPPNLYRKELRDILNVAHDEGYAPHLRDRALAAVQADAQTERLILSNPGFFGTPKMAASAGVLYSAAEMRLATLSEIFGEDRIELFLATCNLATFLPAIFRQTSLNSFDELMRGTPPQNVRWSEMIQRVRTAFPDMPITVWCNEDTPLIWAELVREMAGLETRAPITGEFALLSEIMSESGMKRFKTYLDSHPGMTEIQKRRVIAAFLDKFAEEDAIEEELDLPGWTEALVDELTALYDEDCDVIQHIPGVRVITP
ncbi:hypothetical protein BXY70_0829 [Roseovarius halotolerans]|uniref:Uncharacterized protein n=1 Tax=Roseovarius halotolerans TaxID=505353 RepID=A0A1X6YEI0_9RHOB|nr:hypothetical protein [Roseovarius halotolerans]RKT34805.1 hypothetical protein BXY70_0829 [Roseovarius halotolerans]SLN18465.1 hypothetical protein ROH8110_00568 [Roseovarius halotolerans]